MATYTIAGSSGTALTLRRKPAALRKIFLEVGNVAQRTIVTKAYPVPTGRLYEIPTYLLKVQGSQGAGFAIEKEWEIYRFGVYHNDGSNTHYKSRGLFVAGIASGVTYTIKRFDPTYKVHSARTTEIGAWQVHDGFLIHDGPDVPLTPTNFHFEGLFASIGCLEICGRSGFDRFNEFLISLSGTSKSGTEALLEIGTHRLITIRYLPAMRPLLKEYVI